MCSSSNLKKQPSRLFVVLPLSRISTDLLILLSRHHPQWLQTWADGHWPDENIRLQWVIDTSGNVTYYTFLERIMFASCKRCISCFCLEATTAGGNLLPGNMSVVCPSHHMKPSSWPFSKCSSQWASTQHGNELLLPFFRGITVISPQMGRIHSRILRLVHVVSLWP